MKFPGKRTQHPRKDVPDSRKDASGCEEDTEVAHAHIGTGRQEHVANCADEGEEGDHKPALLEAIRDPGGRDGDEKGDEVGRGGEALGVDKVESHILEDGGQEDGERSVANVATEVHQLRLLVDLTLLLLTMHMNVRL